MLQVKHLVVAIVLFISYSSVSCQNEAFVSCDPAKASSEKTKNECPVNAQCVELGKSSPNGTETGLCACKQNYYINKNYTKNGKNGIYCTEINETVSTTTTTTTQSTTTTVKTLKPTLAPSPQKSTTSQPTTIKVETTTKSNELPSKNANDDKQPDKKANDSHAHILGGIFFPALVVLGFIGAVYGIRKYDVLERSQNYIRNRRGQSHQTRYDGLENDFDDDPLLI